MPGKRKPRGPISRDPAEELSDETFAFIAGHTEGGAPFGVTWEEAAEAERRLAELQRQPELPQKPPRTLRVDMLELESAFDRDDDGFNWWLDTETGHTICLRDDLDREVPSPEEEAALGLIDSSAGRFLLIEGAERMRPSRDDARQFTATVEDEKLQKRLRAALGQRRHAMRHFFDALHGDPGEWERWHREQQNQLHGQIADYLRSEGIIAVYESIPEPRRRSTRDVLLASAAEFVERARKIQGVLRIALVGSITTPKREPKDIDLLVTIAADADLEALAAAGRRLAGHNQQISRGADVFLAGPEGRYLGRTCSWRECAPGLRVACSGTRCGTRIRNDFSSVRLPEALIEAPPVELWPAPLIRAPALPEDVRDAFGLP